MKTLALALVLLGAASTPTHAPVRLLTLGDSFTAGTGATPEQSFPQRLAVRWRARGIAVDVDDPAVNGYSTQELIDRELGELKSFKPTLVTIAIGANDIVRHRELPEFRKNVRDILAAVKAAGVPASQIWVLPQPDWSRSPTAAEFGEPAAFAAKIRAYDAALREEAQAAGAQWVDLTALFAKQADAHQLADDGLHPSAAAYDAWAEQLATRL